MILHGYFRSSASYRVRIALNMKGITVQHTSYHLRKGEQRGARYLALNPQGLVPALELDDGKIITQSLAIIEWLDEHYPEPRLLPIDAGERARVRAFALAIACDIHPVQNLKVLNAIRELGVDDSKASSWAERVNAEGLADCERLVSQEQGPFCFGSAATLADICLVPQLANARRFKVDVSRLPRLLRAEAAAKSVPAFAQAAPELQPDAE
jgi:maleylpyruvate isomerase